MSEAIPVIIVDDIKNHREVLQKKIERYCPELHVAAMCGNIEEAEKAISEHHPEIVFLDIELGRQTGFDFLKNVDDTFKVIFVSGNPNQENLLKAFKENTYGFVTKPIDKDELILAVNKATAEQRNKSHSRTLSEYIQLSNKTDGVKHIRISDIIFLESENTKVHFRLVNSECFTVTETLSTYEELLKPYGFYRVQRSYIININHVEKVLRKEKDIIMQHYPKREIGASRDKELWEKFIAAWEAKAIKPE